MENFPLQLSDVVQYEVEKNFTRGEAKASADLKLGDIITIGTNGTVGKVNVTTPGNVGIVVSAEVKSGEAVAYIENGPAIVREADLDFNSATAAQITTIKTAFADKNVKFRA